MSGILLRRQNLETDTQRYTRETEEKQPGDDRGSDWSDVTTSQEMPSISGNHQKQGISKKGFFPGDFRGNMIFGHLDLRLQVSGT